MKKIFSIIFSLMLCVSIGGFISTTTNNVHASENENTVVSELFIPSGITLEPLIYDSNVLYFESALKLTSANVKESIRLKNELAGEFSMNYLPENSDGLYSASKFSITFTDVITQKSFSLVLTHGTTTSAYLSANGKKVGLCYLSGALQNLTNLFNATDTFTEIVANKINVKFDPDTMSVYVGATGENSFLVWSLCEQEIDGRTFGEVFCPFGKYTVDFAITQIAGGQEGEVLIYDINGCSFDGLILNDNGNVAIYADFAKNAIKNQQYELPTAYVSNVKDGTTQDSKISVSVFDTDNSSVAVQNGKFTPTKSGDYTVTYTFGETSKSYVLKVFDSEPVYQTEIVWDLANEYTANSQITIPKMVLTDGILRYGESTAKLSILKDGTVISGQESVLSGTSFVFEQTGSYTFKYDIGGGNYTSYEVFVTDPKVHFVTDGISNFYELGAFIDASVVNVIDSGNQVDFNFYVEYPNGNRYSNKKFTLTEVGIYTLCAKYNDGQTDYSLTRTITVNSKTSDFFTYTSDGMNIYHGKSLMTGRSGVIVRATQAGQMVNYTLPIDISNHKGIGQLTAVTASKTVTKVKEGATPIIELTVDPKNRGNLEATGVDVYLTDALNPENVLQINVSNRSSSAWSYMRACAPGQDLIGYYNDSAGPFSYDGCTGSITGYGTMFYHAVKGSTSSPYTAKDSKISIYYDSETKQLFTHNARTGLSDIVIDFDDIRFTSNPWSGFESNQVYLSFALAGVSSGGASAIVYSIDGREFTNEDIFYSENPQIVVDESVTFTAIKDRNFSIPKAKAYDCFGNQINKIITKVYYKTSNNLFDVTVANGKFKAEKTGTYVIEYSAKDIYGNVGVKTVEVSVASSYDNVIVNIDHAWEGSAEVATEIALCPITEINVENAVGTINVTRKVYLSTDPNKTPIKTIEDTFYTTTLGQYIVEYDVIDGSERTAVGSYTINVQASNNYVVISSLPTFVGFVRGNSYEIPSVTYLDYSSGSCVEKIAKVYINGEIFNGNIYTVEKGEDEAKDAQEKQENITVEYKCGNDLIKGYNVPVKTVYKKDTVRLPNGFEAPKTVLRQDRYFITENGASVSTASDHLVIASNSNNGKISFVQPLDSSKLNLTFDVNYKKTFEKDENGNPIHHPTNVKSFYITITDALDQNKVLVLKVFTNEQTGYTQMSCGEVISQQFSASFVGLSADQLALRYDNNNKCIIDVVTASQILSPITYENGKEFEGFSDTVYVSFSFECIEEDKDASLRLYSLNNQSFSNSVDTDIGEPVLSVNGNLNGVFYVGNQIVVPTAKAYDVFGSVMGNGKLGVSVILEKDGKTTYVKDVNGLELNNVSTDVEYQVNFAITGDYKIIYVAIDNNGVSSEKAFAVTVVHEEKPVFSFNGKVPKTATVGQEVTIPKASVSYKEVTNNEHLYAFIISPTFDMEIIKNNKFVATEIGTYTVRYFALDTYGNYQIVEYQIEVTK